MSDMLPLVSAARTFDSGVQPAPNAVTPPLRIVSPSGREALSNLCRHELELVSPIAEIDAAIVLSHGITHGHTQITINDAGITIRIDADKKLELRGDVSRAETGLCLAGRLADGGAPGEKSMPASGSDSHARCAEFA